MIGLVDELDDPSPGHLSDYPQPISSTTSTSKPLIGSLEDRFTKATAEEEKEVEREIQGTGETEDSNNPMDVDESEDKENKALLYFSDIIIDLA